MRHRLIARLKSLLARKVRPDDEIARAKALIEAIDRGGVPLNPARINAIARDLGLEVSRQAASGETVERIRQALRRVS